MWGLMSRALRILFMAFGVHDDILSPVIVGVMEMCFGKNMSTTNISHFIITADYSDNEVQRSPNIFIRYRIT